MDKVVGIWREGTAVGSNLAAEGIPEELGIQYPRDILLKWNDPGVVEGEIDKAIADLEKCITLPPIHN